MSSGEKFVRKMPRIQTFMSVAPAGSQGILAKSVAMDVCTDVNLNGSGVSNDYVGDCQPN